MPSPCAGPEPPLLSLSLSLSPDASRNRSTGRRVIAKERAELAAEVRVVPKAAEEHGGLDLRPIEDQRAGLREAGVDDEIAECGPAGRSPPAAERERVHAEFRGNLSNGWVLTGAADDRLRGGEDGSRVEIRRCWRAHARGVYRSREEPAANVQSPQVISISSRQRFIRRR